MVGAGAGFARPVRVWNVPPSYEDNRLPRPDRQAIRRTSDDAELEHDLCSPADFEGSEEHAKVVDVSSNFYACLNERNGDFTPITRETVQ